MFSPRLLKNICLLLVLLTGCSQPPESCPSHTPVDLSGADAFAREDSLPFRFPLDEFSTDETLFFGWFAVSNESWDYSVRMYHAAEDYRRPAGTPVFALADGEVSFSGPAGGYGWLIIIDHPQANLYSLYGHLSPSRWRIEAGMVKKGQLIAYLGDSDENGGSAMQPLEPHLHFGIRAGQTRNYPGKGEWRFMAGWIKLCPQDLGWLQPSLVVTSQMIPVGGYTEPKAGFLALWGVEALLTGFYTLGGMSMLVFAIRKKKPFFWILPAAILIAAGIIFHNNGMVRTYTLLAIGILIAVTGIYCHRYLAGKRNVH